MSERPRPASSKDSIGLPQGELYRGGRIGKYEVLTQLSVGGMAELFLAFTSGPGGFRKFVVIKRILPDARANENFVRMFLDEARITAALSHPNIAQVYDLGDEVSGPFLAMEFIAGQNLNQIGALCLKRRQALPVGFSVAVARELCQALHYAHSFVEPSGEPFPVIHRDVAQKNVMVTYDGAVKLLDFGIAKARRSLGSTNAGMVKGTTGYMSPEQVRGEPLDGRSDIFSAAVMLHELLTGRRLFAAQTEAEEMERILAAPIPRPSSLVPALPERISEVVMQALSRRREERPPTARAWARQLEVATGKLMFDQDAISSFMRELFEGKIAATRALLESAGEEEETLVSRSAAAALTEDAGASFPDGAAGHAPAPAPAEESESPRPEPAGSPDNARPGGTIWLLGVGGLLLAIGVALYALSDRILPPSPQAEVPASPGTLPSFGEVGSPAAPEPPGGAAAGPGAAPRIRSGTLTLVTTPECDVFGGNRSLGKTPLFNVPLPAGTHLVKLKGPDGVTHLLSVPIRSGHNTAFRLSLEDLPTSDR